MFWPLWIAPLIIFAELAQLVIAERHLGVAVLKSGVDPRTRPGLSLAIGWCWFFCAALCIAYPGLLVFFGQARFQALVMMAVTVVGFEVRRRTGLRLALVTFTFEGAVRIGMLAQMFVLWYWLGNPRLPGLP